MPGTCDIGDPMQLQEALETSRALADSGADSPLAITGAVAALVFTRAICDMQLLLWSRLVLPEGLETRPEPRAVGSGWTYGGVRGEVKRLDTWLVGAEYCMPCWPLAHRGRDENWTACCVLVYPVGGGLLCDITPLYKDTLELYLRSTLIAPGGSAVQRLESPCCSMGRK